MKFKKKKENEIKASQNADTLYDILPIKRKKKLDEIQDRKVNGLIFRLKAKHIDQNVKHTTT